MAHHPEVYAQCRLRRGNTFQTAWIPSIFAVRGKYLRIRNVDGWRVIGVGKFLNHSYVLNVLSNEHRHHRSVTDI
jgi:hypothetical protein